MPIRCVNHSHLYQCYKSGSNALLEGGSRSRKTFGGIDFLIHYCTMNDRKVINIIRETYNSFKTTLYLDFSRRLPEFGIESPFGSVKEIPQFHLYGNQINFLGADNPNKFLGAGCDVFWINEALDVNRQIFDQSEQRCREFWWMDYNPKNTDHWVFDLEKRPDVKLKQSTLFDNPFVSAIEKRKIMSYEPTPENIAHGTADDYMWKVYGLGERAALSGLIFPDVTWIDSFPTGDMDWVAYGLDFGHTNSPSALVRCGAFMNNLYLQGLFYAPCDNPRELALILDEHKAGVNGSVVWCDAAEPMPYNQLRAMGYDVIPAPKPQGSVLAGIDIMKSKKIHIVNNDDFRKEQLNYKWREINGYKINEPVKAFDHYWDGSRYCCGIEIPRNS